MKVATFDSIDHGIGAGPGLRLGPHRVDAGVGTASLGHFLDAVVDILLHEIDGLRTGLCRQRQTLRHGIDGNHPAGAQEKGAADRKLPDRPAAPDGDGLAALDVAEFRAHVARGKDVREEQDLLVGQPFRHLDGPDIGIGHAQIFSLPAAISAEQM